MFRFCSYICFAFLLSVLSLKESSALGACGPIEPNFHQSNLNDLGENYTNLIVDLLNEFELLPGVSIGIVKKNELIYAQGFGFGNIETCSPATPETGFYLLSTTKSFTGMVGALLHEEGTLQLEQTILDYFPNLIMPGPLNPGQITIRQLLTHGKPYSNGGINFLRTTPGESNKEQELMVLSKYSEPKPPFFEYSNDGYNLAGDIYEKATGKNWRKLIEEKIFSPLGMTNSTAYIEKALARDFAQRYSIDKEAGIFEVPNKLEEQMHPAGGTVSTVKDLSAWVITNLNQGFFDGKQVFPKTVVRQALAPQIQFEWTYYKFKRYAYGLGVHNADYEGDLLIHHFGGAIHVSFMPDQDLGVIVLTNNVVSGGILSHRIAGLTYDFLLKKAEFDGRVQTAKEEAKESIGRVLTSWAQRKQKAFDRANPEDPFVEANSLPGSYESERLGTIEIFLNGETLLMRYGVVVAKMARLDGNSFTTYFDDLDQGIPQVFDFLYQENKQVLNWDGRIYEKTSP